MTDPKEKLELAIKKTRYNHSKSKEIQLKATLNGSIVGFVIWSADPLAPPSPPSSPMSDAEKARDKAIRDSFMKGADLTLLKSMGKEHDAAEQMVPSPHWYLGNIVVAPEAQGHGVGTVLLKYGLDKADVQGLPVFCLSSDEGWQLYSRNGFEVMRWCNFQTSKGESFRERAVLRPAQVSK